MNSQWIRARFHGSELRSYQRHFSSHSLSAAASTAGGPAPLTRPRSSSADQPAVTDQRAAAVARRRAGRPLAAPFAVLVVFVVFAVGAGSISARNAPV